MAISDRLKQIRKQSGKTQEEIAEVLHTTQQQYSKYETGVHELPARVIIQLCKYYKISADWLLGLEE